MSDDGISVGPETGASLLTDILHHRITALMIYLCPSSVPPSGMQKRGDYVGFFGITKRHFGIKGNPKITNQLCLKILN